MILAIDHAVFTWINQLPHTLGLDTFAMAISGIGNAGAVWIILALYLFFREERQGWHFFRPFLAAGIIASIVSELILKPAIGRMRPAILIDAIVVGNEIPRTFSFPSTHATLAWALATVIAGADARIGKTAYILAALICLSRVYLGMHYPIDVAVGGILGWVIGTLCVRLLFGYRPTKKKARARRMR